MTGGPFGRSQQHAQLERDLKCLFAGGLLEDNGELVAADPREDARVAQPVAEQLCDGFQEVVAGGVAIRVVGRFEVIDIEAQQRAAVAVAPGVSQDPLELAEQSPAAVQAGQRVEL